MTKQERLIVAALLRLSAEPHPGTGYPQGIHAAWFAINELVWRAFLSEPSHTDTSAEVRAGTFRAAADKVERGEWS